MRFAAKQALRSSGIKLLKDKSGVIAIIYALSLLPLVVVIALAVDFGFYVMAQSQLNLAADAAAIHAVRVAQQTYLDYSSTTAQAITAGQTAGQQWFYAQLGTLKIATVTPNVSVTYSPPPGGFSAAVTYQGTVATTVGSFLLASWPISNTASGGTGAHTTNSFLEVIIMLDNSSSMQIGASYSDIELMMRITPCMAYNAWYWQSDWNYNFNNGVWPFDGPNGGLSGPYGNYQCNQWSGIYTGALACPITNATSALASLSSLLSPPYIATTLSPPYITTTPIMSSSYTNSIWTGPACSSTFSPVLVNGSYPVLTSPAQVSGSQAFMSAPCAFACHSDGSVPAGAGQDNYALARSTIGSANPITLRFDLLKIATNRLLSTMQSAAGVSRNLSVGIYTFNTTLTQVYPSSGESGNDFTSAGAAVGGPPTVANGPDTGIQPQALSGNNDTDFYGTMTSLANQLTISGDGSSASSPKKVLFLITDGFQDFDATGAGAIDVSRCSALKSMGYTIYVIYTPYYPLMHVIWTSIYGPMVNYGASLSSNLQSCASSYSDYFEATDLTGLNAALQKFMGWAAPSASLGYDGWRFKGRGRGRCKYK